MKRKDKIVEQARIAFNEEGVNAISLKTIAQRMGISYGNVTYHFATKKPLVEKLYLDMLEEHRQITTTFSDPNNLLQDIILAPNATFEISLKYRFLFIDFTTIIRKYPHIYEQQQTRIQQQMNALLPVFDHLKQQGYFRQDIHAEQTIHLMQMSGVIRTFFFMDHSIQLTESKNLKELQQTYLHYVNQLLYPYLTPSGLQIYNATLNLD